MQMERTPLTPLTLRRRAGTSRAEGRRTWQSSTFVFITPFMYSFSMVGDTPKLFPMHRISARPSGYVTSTEPFRITDHESS